jgi:hypothetical protein
MKKISKTVAVLIVAATFGSCSNFLDTDQDIYMTPETVETNRSSIGYLANAFYAPVHYGFGALDNNLFAVASDEAQQTNPSGNYVYFNKGAINENVNPLWSRYVACYDGIRAANLFLEFVKDGKGEALLALNRDTVRDEVNYRRDLESLKFFRAEAQVVKAYYYSDLAKMYGGVPIIEQTAQSADQEKVSKTGYNETVDYIVHLIDTHKEDLSVNWDEYQDRNGRFTLGAALAVKSRTLLYAASPLHNPENARQKWMDAAKAAHDIISHSALEYRLHPGYGEYFTGGNPLTSRETIYAVRKDRSNSPEQRNYPISTAGGESGVAPSQNLVEAYESFGTYNPGRPYDNRDPRLDASIVHQGSFWNGRAIDLTPKGSDDMTVSKATPTGYYLKKFLTDNLNLTQAQTAQHNWVVFRYAEILLNYAEAINEAYGPDYKDAELTLSAKEALKLIRNRASTLLPANYLTVSDPNVFKEIIKNERRIELAFEDHRYWDLLRWKDAEQVLNRPLRGVRVAGTYSSPQYTEINVADRIFDPARHYALPFLRSEITNSGGILIQNEGY